MIPKSEFVAMAAPSLDHQDIGRLTSRAAVASVGVALLLVCLKIWAQVQADSAALLASLADSALDVVASVVTLISVRYAAEPPDAEHRFGHGKAEALAGVFQAGVVALSSILVAWTSLQRLLNPEPLAAEGVAMMVMVVSIVVTGALVGFQAWTIRQTASIATKGDMAHYMSDFLTNIVALLGIAAAGVFGVFWADGAAGLFVALWLAHGAWGIASEAADHLLDREASDETRAQIKSLAQSVDGLRRVHDLRTRMSGPWLHIQFHADVDPDLTLGQAHLIIVEAENAIRAAFPGADIIIHPDPDDGSAPHGHPAFGLMHHHKA
jgi:ferrous-iron efflux pump FieF